MLPTKTDTEVNMKSYTHFTLNERKYLQESLENGDSIRKIAKALRRSPSTISREIKQKSKRDTQRIATSQVQAMDFRIFSGIALIFSHENAIIVNYT